MFSKVVCWRAVRKASICGKGFKSDERFWDQLFPNFPLPNTDNFWCLCRRQLFSNSSFYHVSNTVLNLFLKYSTRYSRDSKQKMQKYMENTGKSWKMHGNHGKYRENMDNTWKWGKNKGKTKKFYVKMRKRWKWSEYSGVSTELFLGVPRTVPGCPLNHTQKVSDDPKVSLESCLNTPGIFHGFSYFLFTVPGKSTVF